VQALSIPEHAKSICWCGRGMIVGVADTDRTLWPEVARQRVAAAFGFGGAARRSTRPAGRLNIRFSRVQLQPPPAGRQPPIQLWAIQAEESTPTPKGVAAHCLAVADDLARSTRRRRAVEKVQLVCATLANRGSAQGA